MEPGERAARLRQSASEHALRPDDPERMASPAEVERLVRRLAAQARAAPHEERAARMAALDRALARLDDLRLARDSVYLDALRAHHDAEATAAVVRLAALEAALAARRDSREARLRMQRERLVGP